MPKKKDDIPDNNFKLIRVLIISFTVLVTIIGGIWIQASSNVAKEEVQKEETRIEIESEVKRDEIILDYLDSSRTQ